MPDLAGDAQLNGHEIKTPMDELHAVGAIESRGAHSKLRRRISAGLAPTGDRENL